MGNRFIVDAHVASGAVSGALCKMPDDGFRMILQWQQGLPEWGGVQSSWFENDYVRSLEHKGIGLLQTNLQIFEKSGRI